MVAIAAVLSGAMLKRRLTEPARLFRIVGSNDIDRTEPGSTLIVFAGFSVLYLKEPLGWNHGLGFALIAAGAFFIFHKWS
jgi:uncharacterized protein (DUF486 family)